MYLPTGRFSIDLIYIGFYRAFWNSSAQITRGTPMSDNTPKNHLARTHSWIVTERPGTKIGSKQESCLIIDFKGNVEPMTLQALSRETAAWTDYLTNLAYVQRCDPILPIAGIRRDSLVIAITADGAIVSAMATLWVSILTLGKKRLEKREIKVEIERLMHEEEEFEEAPQNKQAPKILHDIFVFLMDFQQKGGDIQLKIPDVALQENPRLKEILDIIEEHHDHVQHDSSLETITASRGDYVLVSIPGGDFQMGTPKNMAGRYDTEGPRHIVRVPEFYMGRYPVTNEEYGRFLKANPKNGQPEYWEDAQFNQPGQPVVGVSWQDAKRYCKWAGLRLPSEAEWEYACRAGTDTRYCAGDEEADLDRVGWYSGNSGDRLHPVGEKEPNAFGLYDMHGNVWEWCEDDWHERYEGAPTDSTAWIDEPRGEFRVVRGGSWGDYPVGLRAANRDLSAPDSRYPYGSFRCVR